MTKIVTMEPWHIMAVALNLREFDITQLRLYTDEKDAQTYACKVALAPGIKFAVLDDKHLPVACFGITDEVPGVGTMWILGTDAWKAHVKSIKRATLRLFEEKLYRRVQAWIEPGNAVAKRYAEWHGFEFEGRCKKLTPSGADMDLYSRT